jgi:hypothetical protein
MSALTADASHAPAHRSISMARAKQFLALNIGVPSNPAQSAGY